MKRETTTETESLRERASATPAVGGVRASGESAGVLFEVPERLALRAHQELFAAAVTTPESQPMPLDAPRASRLVLPSATLTSLERLEIYRRSYHARRIECLVDDYPVLQQAMGEVAFDSLCRDYIAQHPSTEPNLNGFGRHMAAFCRSEPKLPFEAGLAADLATLEWAIVEAVHAPTAAPLTAERLSRVPADQWASVRLVANPSLRILCLEHPVNAYFQACRRGEAPALPGPSPSSVAVFRTELTVWRMELAPPMVRLFESLASGTALGAALAEIIPLLDDAERAGGQVLGWFRDGVSSGLFAGISQDSAA